MFKGPGPGRPKGGLNRTTKEVRDAARAIVDDPEYRATLKIRVCAGEAPHMETLLWHYAYGKPKETVEIEGGVTVEKVVREVIRPGDEISQQTYDQQSEDDVVH